MYSVFIGALQFAPDQDGKSRALCLVSSSAFKGHAPRQTYKTPIRSLVHLRFTCRFLCFSPLRPCGQVLAAVAVRYRSPVVSTAHAMRANLLAIATAATLTCILTFKPSTHAASGVDLSLTRCNTVLAP
jgi:hypothetical protein